MTGWGDALFELCDAALCTPGPVGSVPALSLEPTFRRSHGSLYKSLAQGEVDAERLRLALVQNRPKDWPQVFAVDASVWDRCDAECSPGRGFYYSASKHSAGQPIVAGWSYQWICQLSFDADSWTVPLDALRISPTTDATDATIDQVRRLCDALGPQKGPAFPLREEHARMDDAIAADARTSRSLDVAGDRRLYAASLGAPARRRPQAAMGTSP
jgi:hypothetical protein